MYYHAKDLRRGRFYGANQPYLITTVTHDRKKIFRDFDISRILIRELQTTCIELNIESLAWVIMPDHFHWLLKLKDSKGDFSKVLQSFKRNFTLNY